tara:strand:+ start:5753 stop:5992 length:240 start_codon:yes stop_codon:yes gene_type:complete
MSGASVSVRIDSSRPIFIEADADSFGAVFAAMDNGDQVEVLRAMVNHMKPHQQQWDFIAIELELEANREIVAVLKGLFS